MVDFDNWIRGRSVENLHGMVRGLQRGAQEINIPGESPETWMELGSEEVRGGGGKVGMTGGREGWSKEERKR